MTFLSVMITSGTVIIGLMTVLWIYSLRREDAGIVDIFWGSGFVLVNWLSLLLVEGEVTVRSWFLAALVTLWGARLTLHIYRRNQDQPEDFRYANWRLQYGSRWWWRSYFQVFLLQGAIMLIVALPIMATHHYSNSSGLTALETLAVLIWGIGFFFEVVGDRQLAQFRSNPKNKGRLLTSGLWRYTRHPNYFGDSAQWWGFYLFALSSGAWWTIVSPLLMTYLLIEVSGVAMLERTLKVVKPDYQNYIARTNSFFPWFPKPGQQEVNGISNGSIG